MPERPEDVDEAFARLVAGYDRSADTGDGDPWPEAENLRDQASDDSWDAEPATPEPTTPEPARPEPASAGVAAGHTSGVDALDSEASWDDEGHFVPPPPPPLPRPAPVRLVAWLAVLVGPVVMTLVAGLGWWVPDIVTTVLVIGFVAGVVYLIATMGDGPRDPYGPDNGAVV